MEIAQKPSTDGRTEPPTNEADVFARNFFWVCLIAWGISFFLPAARYEDWGQTKTMLGWEAAFTSLMLLIVPVKGLLLGLLIPHVWSVFANVFMIWAPFKIRRVSPTNSRKFSISFTASSLLAVGLLFIPESMDLARIRAFEVGYVLWTLSLIGASASFCWLIWGERRAVVPHTLLAATLFCGLFVWSPFLAGKWHRAQQQRDQWAWLTKANQQYSAEHAADISAIAQRGLLAFNTPLNSTQEDDLESYILSAQQFTPEDLIAASERYQNPTIMNALAQKPNCPPEALAILFQHATEKEKEADPIQKARAQRVYFQIAKSPNTSPSLLLKMLRTGPPNAHIAVLRSGRLSTKEKADYLEKACALTDDMEMLAIAQDADTPVEVLECLAKEPVPASGVAQNPHTPISILEEMSASPDGHIANEAKIWLAQRERQAK